MTERPSSVMHERLFASVLTRERRRTDRSSQPFILMRIEVADSPGARASWLWDAIVDVLDTTKDDTEVLGWCRWRRTLGMIVPDVREHDVATAQAALEAEVRRALAKRLDAEALDRVSISLQTYPAAAAEPTRPTISDAVKRAVDIVGSLALLAVVVPLVLLIAALVKLGSRGPVFFKQTRIGYRNEPFTMLKFRTMHVNADEKLHQDFVSSFITAAAGNQPTTGLFKLANDPRVTAIGHVLRKTSLDELPQLWNVVRGDMSLVGPRPPIPYELEQYKGWHRRRVHEAKPGITGLWQVTGRSRTTFDDMVRLDLQYARSRSLWMDIKLLLATPRAVISGKGAC